MSQFRTLCNSVLALILCVNLTLGSAWHDHAGHAPVSHDDAALELASHDHSASAPSHSGHAHEGHAHEGHAREGHCRTAGGEHSPVSARSQTAQGSPAHGWSPTGHRHEHPDDCAVCRFLGQSSAPTRVAEVDHSQPVVAAMDHPSTTSPVSRLQRRQQSRAPPAVS